jgi:hypothetical protein
MMKAALSVSYNVQKEPGAMHPGPSRSSLLLVYYTIPTAMSPIDGSSYSPKRPENDALHAVGGSNLPRAGKLRGCLNAQDDALDMYFTCGLSDLTGGDQDQPERRPD